MDVINNLIHMKYTVTLGIFLYILVGTLLLYIGERVLKNEKYIHEKQSKLKRCIIYLSGILIGFLLVLNNPLEYVGILFICGLVSAWITDLRSGYILNIMTYPLLLLGITTTILDLIQGTPFLVSSLAGMLLVLVIFTVAFIVRPGAMGFGDIKLFLVISLFMTPVGIFMTILLSCISGLIVGSYLIYKNGASKAFVFGPHIVIGVLLVALFNLDTINVLLFNL